MLAACKGPILFILHALISAITTAHLTCHTWCPDGLLVQHVNQKIGWTQVRCFSGFYLTTELPIGIGYRKVSISIENIPKALIPILRSYTPSPNAFLARRASQSTVDLPFINTSPSVFVVFGEVIYLTTGHKRSKRTVLGFCKCHPC
jgi:hypothetical protein